MSSSDLENYKFQLTQVSDALEKDPSNTELLKLRHDLEQVISLFNSLSDAQHHKQSNEGPSLKKMESKVSQNTVTDPDTHNTTKNWEIGQLVLAKYSDGRFYEARIVGQSGDDFYQVIYTGYTDVERVSASNLKDPIVANPTVKAGRTGSEVVVDAAPTKNKSAHDGAGIKSTKKKMSRKERLEKKEVEHMERQKAWLSFAQGAGTSKKKKIGGLPKKSMFATPDDPHAKVGVIGSGKPMTQFQSRGKHLYQKEDI